jgi:hydrogenase expression/formation protein HypD
MKYMQEFRDAALVRGLSAAIAKASIPGRSYAFMEFCGGHTHTIARYGLEDLLPPQVRLIHGPGCPVCVLPVGRVDGAIALARDHNVILCTYGDMMRVPGSARMTLIRAKAAGADVRMVLSTLDALKIARLNPDRQVVFLAIGFETTTPPTAIALKLAKAERLDNFSVYCNHVLTPSAMGAVLVGDDLVLEGIIGPGHVSVIIGTEPYEVFAEQGHPIVVAGFEPLDLLQAVLRLIYQVNAGLSRVENAYSRALAPRGNPVARAAMTETMSDRRPFEWRGLGVLADSAVQINDDYAAFDAERRFTVPAVPAADPKSCRCADVVRGLIHPQSCKLFGTTCTPDDPIGSCMVSNEGACAAHYLYGRHRAARVDATVAA